MFIPLRAQSYYSFLRGLASPKELAQIAECYHLPALGLTDHHSLTGAIEFYDACQTAGVRPILGLEVNAAPPPGLELTAPGVLALMATDLTGWRSLCRIASALDGDKAVLPFDILAQECAGLLCLTGGYRGRLTQLVRHGQFATATLWLDQMQEIYTGRLYVELQRHTPEDHAVTVALAAICQRQHLPFVATHDIYYLNPQQSALSKLLAAIRVIRPLNELPTESCAPPDAVFHPPDELTHRFQDMPAAVAATAEIGDRCRLELPLGKPRFPEIELPEGMTALDLLSHKAHTGAVHIYDSSVKSRTLTTQNRSGDKRRL